MRSIAGVGGCRILDDSYNANPASMQAALDTLKSLPGRRIAVLGDMAELGRDSASLHAGLDVEGVDIVLLLGSEMQHLSEKFPSARHMQDVEQLWRALGDLQLNANDTLLIKGSRCMHMEQVVRALQNARTDIPQQGGGDAL